MKDNQPTKTDVLIHRLMLMAESGGMITKDRQRTLFEAAGRMRDLNEAVMILENTGGEADEER